MQRVTDLPVPVLGVEEAPGARLLEARDRSEHTADHLANRSARHPPLRLLGVQSLRRQSPDFSCIRKVEIPTDCRAETALENRRETRHGRLARERLAKRIADDAGH